MIVAHHGGELPALAGLAATATVLVPPLALVVRARLRAFAARARARRG